MHTNYLLISVDVEEFDIPEEYGHTLGHEEKLNTSYRGVVKTLALFDELGIRATFFITAYWAQCFPELVKRIALRHEIASHAFFHSSFEDSHLLRSRQELQQLSGQAVTGFRMPRLQPVNMAALQDAGYTYDASLNPTWLPGRYNNRRAPRTLHHNGSVWVMPSSVTPGWLRLPVFWLSVKNFPLWFTRRCVASILRQDGCLTFYFHPWELEDLSAYPLPAYVKRRSGERMYDRLHALLAGLASKGTFVSHDDYLTLRLEDTSGGCAKSFQ